MGSQRAGEGGTPAVTCSPPPTGPQVSTGPEVCPPPDAQSPAVTPRTVNQAVHP